MRFGVLGPLAVWTDAGEEVRVPGAKVRALLADLLVHRGTVRTAEQLVDDLWERDPPDQAAGALQAKVSQLRRALDDAEPGARALVVSRGPGYVLDVGPDAVDAERFAALVVATDDGPAAVAARLAEALALWRGPALADVADAAFARPAVAELEEQRLAATEAHLDARSALGEADAVVAELATLAEHHPLRERLHGALMRALYRAGRQGEALARFERLRVTLADELGVDPSPELVALHGAILRQDPDLAPASPPAAAPPSGRGAAPALPVAWDETVGRADEIGGLRTALAASRLVTVVGPGGVGKTRLALEAARALADATPDGARFVDLTVVGAAGADEGGRAADAVADAVSEALGLRDDVPAGSGTTRSAAVVDGLADSSTLLLLDNCEHVLDAVAELVAELMRRAPRVRVLATSREPLGLRGEQLRPLTTLGLPAPGDDPATSPAVRLFVARAAGTDPTFALTATTAPLVTAVCRRLDGLPLALELAAARVRTLGLSEVAARLDDRFALLDSGPRDAPARQRTLRAVMDWSWEPLSQAERAVLRRLAACGDGASADLVEAVCPGGPVPVDGALRLVARLVDRSLVTAVETPGGMRWRMLETVAAYAGERLEESGEAEAVRLRHAVGVAALVERAAPYLRGPDQAAWLLRLDHESADVRVALDTAVAAGEGALALRIAVAADWYWYLRGRRSTARRALARALDVAGDERSVARADAVSAHAAIRIRERSVADPVAVSRDALAAYDGLDAAGALARAQWRHAAAVGCAVDLAYCEGLLDAALATLRAQDDRWGVAGVRIEQGALELMRGRIDGVRAAAHEAGELLDELGDRWGSAHAAGLLGQLDEIAGDHDVASARHREALGWAEELRLWPVVILHHNRLGRLALMAGDHAAADAHHDRALALAVEHGLTADATFARLGLALAARRRGRLDEAEELLHAVHAAHGSSPREPGTTITFAELGFVAEQRGELGEADRLHRVGLGVARRNGDVRAVALALEGLAGVAALSGAPERAAVLLGAAAAAREGAGTPLPAGERGDVDRIRAAVVAVTGEEAFTGAHERGRAAGPELTAGEEIGG